MTRPSFRNTSRGGGPRPGPATTPAVWGSPFSQAQILHLMKSEFARARRHGLPLAVAILQVDRLRALVDLYGVELRDTVREAVGKLMAEGTRSSDFVGSINEDRFVLLMPHTDGAQAEVAAERLRQRFTELAIRARGQELALALSVGIATNADKETLFFDTLLSQAEVALDWARRSGGNRVFAFSRDRFAREEGDGGDGAGSAGPGADAGDPADSHDEGDV